MVNIGQVKRGIANFVDAEILNKIPGGSLKRTLIGAAMGLYIGNLEKTFAGATKSAYVTALGVTDESGNIDIDRLAEEIKKNMPPEGVKIDLDVMGFHLGDMTLHASDIEVLRVHVVNA